MSDRLEQILETMDIPSRRRDTGDDNNLRWLLRNLAIVNQNNPDFHEAIRLIKSRLSYYLGE